MVLYLHIIYVKIYYDIYVLNKLIYTLYVAYYFIFEVPYNLLTLSFA